MLGFDHETQSWIERVSLREVLDVAVIAGHDDRGVLRCLVQQTAEEGVQALERADRLGSPAPVTDMVGGVVREKGQLVTGCDPGQVPACFVG